MNEHRKKFASRSLVFVLFGILLIIIIEIGFLLAFSVIGCRIYMILVLGILTRIRKI